MLCWKIRKQAQRVYLSILRSSVGVVTRLWSSWPSVWRRATFQLIEGWGRKSGRRVKLTTLSPSSVHAESLHICVSTALLSTFTFGLLNDAVSGSDYVTLCSTYINDKYVGAGWNRIVRLCLQMLQHVAKGPDENVEMFVRTAEV